MKKEPSEMKKSKDAQTNASVVDLFCGAGGLSFGFKKEGFIIGAGIDTDESCRYPYEKNIEAPFIRSDVEKLKSCEVDELFVPGSKKVLIGCAPCQPFSKYNQNNDDPKWRLLGAFSTLIANIKPDIVSMENVPQLLNFKNGSVFKKFIRKLEQNEYDVNFDVLFAPEFGLPQRRSRLVLLASRLGPIDLPRPTHKKKYKTVYDAIGGLPPLISGDSDPKDILHKSSQLSEINLKRIKSASPGGTWLEWESNLVAKCHKKETGKSYGSVYGRMKWDEPSPTVTTQFYGFGNGRFGHPEQDRAISLREGAILQGFPRSYRFVSPGEEVQMTAVGRMIGNAVPVILAKAIAKAVRRHLLEVGNAY